MKYLTILCIIMMLAATGGYEEGMFRFGGMLIRLAAWFILACWCYGKEKSSRVKSAAKNIRR